MMKKIICTFLLAVSAFSLYSKTWIITNSGAHFTPDSLDITAGDSVRFMLTNTHNVVEVSKGSWEAEESVALPGGFSLGFTGGLLLPAQLSTGKHYYICEPHITLGMKGILVVHPANAITELLRPIITLFPNPAREAIVVKIPTELLGCAYVITDEAGRQVDNGKLEKIENQLAIEKLNNGIYFFSCFKRNERYAFIKN